MGSSVGVGPKVYDILGEPKYGFSTSCCGVGPGVGTDVIFGTGRSENLYSVNFGASAPGQLASVSAGYSAKGYTYGASAAVRVLPAEVSVSWSVNVQRLYQWAESSIYRMYGVSRY